MTRNMWLLAALFAVLAIALIYQSEFSGGLERPWAECRENLIQQMISGNCTPRQGVITSPPPAASGN